MSTPVPDKGGKRTVPALLRSSHPMRESSRRAINLLRLFRPGRGSLQGRHSATLTGFHPELPGRHPNRASLCAAQIFSKSGQRRSPAALLSILIGSGIRPRTYDEADPAFGTWEDVEKISRDFDRVIDFMVNHISRQSIFSRIISPEGQTVPPTRWHPGSVEFRVSVSGWGVQRFPPGSDPGLSAGSGRLSFELFPRFLKGSCASDTMYPGFPETP